ncbi:RtcB family protein [Polaromonas jejuensis]|uniref:3'-phosphate/5'-hydroxy nucleic acid ligase n=1 Tax=Polaromonas jejuensis TaxID=457502 RepID=A0ABW0Q9K7_9BURK|nr:RtcB family protein [Polaromonas jejuensis]
MQVIKEPGAFPIKAWTDSIENSALVQLKNLARLPFLSKNGVAVMPDVHAGIGATVGSVIAAHRAIIPAAVGVDIGCGMNAVRLSLKATDLPDSLKALRDQIEHDVPVGFSAHQKSSVIESNWSQRNALHRQWMALFADFPGLKAKNTSVETQLGTLGGGNHFLEICLDESQNVWIMLHSGSRGTGNAIGRYFIEKAKEECERWHIKLPDNDLAYLPEGSKTFDDYVRAVEWAQTYALENRAVMMELILKALRKRLHTPFEVTQEAINCHHNYVARENHFGQDLWVTRKGAIRAREGDLGIIPGSMGQRSFIVRGKGNLESYCSCSHGAGRAMSRTEARKRFSLSDLVAQTVGVECRKDKDVIDEIPGAYKSIDAVMDNQRDLVEVVHTLKQVLCVKG